MSGRGGRGHVEVCWVVLLVGLLLEVSFVEGELVEEGTGGLVLVEAVGMEGGIVEGKHILCRIECFVLI